MLELFLLGLLRLTVTLVVASVEQPVAPVNADGNGNDGVDSQGNTVALHEGPDRANSSDQTEVYVSRDVPPFMSCTHPITENRSINV